VDAVLSVLSELKRGRPLTNMPLANLLTNLPQGRRVWTRRGGRSAAVHHQARPACQGTPRSVMLQKKEGKKIGSCCLSNIWIFFLVERMLAAARGCYLTGSIKALLRLYEGSIMAL
jgi:hypothetical protein